MAQLNAFDNVSRASENPLEFFVTTTASTYRYRGLIGASEQSSAIATGYGRNIVTTDLNSPDLESDKRHRLSSQYKDDYTRREKSTVPDIASDMNHTKHRSTYSKYNAFHYNTNVPIENQSESSSSYRPCHLLNYGDHKILQHIAKNGFTNNCNSTKQIITETDNTRKMESEFEAQYDDPLNKKECVSHKQISDTSDQRNLSGYAKSLGSPACSSHTQDGVSEVMDEFVNPNQRHSITLTTNSVRQTDACNLYSTTGFVRNESTGFHVPKVPQQRQSRKGGVNKRADCEGNLKLHKPHKILEGKLARCSVIFKPSDITVAPQHSSGVIDNNIPDHVMRRVTKTHWNSL